MRLALPSVIRIAALAIVAVLGLFLARHVSSSAEDRAWAIVRRAYLDGASLAGCPSWLAATPPTDDSAPSDETEVLAAAATLDTSSRTKGQSTDVVRAAFARLQLGHARLATDLLEREVARRPSAQSWSDLAVAYLNAEPAAHRVESATRALDAAMRAATLDPDFSPAKANLVVAASRLHLDSFAARSAENAAGSPCNARLHRSASTPSFEAAVAQAASGSDGETGQLDASFQAELLERVVLKDWATSVLDEPRGAAQAAAGERARVLARAVGETTADPFFPDLVAFLLSPADHSTLPVQQRARLWLRYLDGLDSIESEDVVRMGSLAPGADLPAMGRTGTAMRAALQLVESTVLRLSGQSTQARVVLAEVLRDAAGHGYLRLQGRALWYLGLMVEESGDLGASVHHYTRAAPLLARSADLEGAAVVASRLARFFQRIGERQRAWGYLDDALRRLPHARRYRRDALLRAAAVMATSANLHGAALAFQDQPYHEALVARSPGGLSFLMADRAMALHGMQASVHAERAIAEAADWLTQLPEGPTAAMASAVYSRSRATILESRDPEAALTLLAQASQIYRFRGDAFATAELQLQRGRILRRSGRAAEAATALADGVASVERMSAAMSAAQRVRASAVAWSIYRELADVEVAARDYAAALAVLERGRHIGHASLAAEAGDQRVEEAVVLTFGFLPSGAFGMVRTGSTDRYFPIPVSSDAMSDLVSRYIAALVASSPDADHLGARLFDLLVAPARKELATAVRLIVVPDAAVSSLPFSALPTGTGHLIDSHAVVTQASLVDARSRRRFDARTAKVAVFGDPQSHHDLSLPPLPWARRESETVASLYEDAVLRTGHEATPEALRRDLARVNVLHIAAHAIADQADPTMSRLVLAPDADGATGLVFERDIASLPMAGLQVVVLAGCGTAQVANAVGPAVLGLARSFVNQGAGAVVATLWSVPDEGASRVLVEFHRELLKGKDPGDALRDAQRAAALAGVPPSVWGAMIVTGATAPPA